MRDMCGGSWSHGELCLERSSPGTLEAMTSHVIAYRVNIDWMVQTGLG